MRKPVSLLLLLGCAAFAETATERRAAYPEVYAKTELARAAPPEFAAHGLLRILDAEAIPAADWRLQLAQEVLELAAAARHPMKRRLAPGIPAVDNRAALWNTAYRHGLDGLALSMRAIEHIRRLDPDAARKAFQQLPRPAPGQTTCADPLVDDASAWFEMAIRLQLDPLPMLQSIRTQGEIAPAIDLIFAAGVQDLHAGALAQKLRELPAEGRAFSSAVFVAPRKLKHLYMVLESQQRPAAALGDGWRAWMQANLEAQACQESRGAGPQEQARHEAFALFNETIPPPLSAELLKPAGIAEATNLEPFSETEATREQTRLFKQLLFGSQSRGLSAAEKNTPEWREQMQKFIQSIEARTRSGDESSIEYFYRQSQLWAGVLMAAPAGPGRDRAMQQYIAFLLLHAPEMDPLIWYSQLEAMAEISRSLHGEEFAKTLRALHLTAHPVLRLYAELESAYPLPPGAKVN